ncbi:MAG: WD40/YVTN/BNR-like repeat-containing protein [Candidatus Dormibacteria bacterium]
MITRARGWRPHRWQVICACLAAVVVSAGMIGWGVLGAWQGLTENASNSVTAANASGVPVTSLHCSGLSPAYPASCSDTSGTVTLAWTQVAGSTGITVERSTSPTGTFSTIATLAGTATTYTDSTAAYNTQYYYEVFSGASGWVSATDLDMALSLPPTGGTDDTVGTGGTAFTAANLTAMSVAGGPTYTTTTGWGSAGTTVLDSQQVNGLSCASATQCWAATASGDVWATGDGGYTWIEQAGWGGQTLYGVDFVNASYGWAVGGNKENIYATTNGGATWSQQSSHPGATFYGVAFAGASDGWVVGSGGIIWATTNGGTTWTAQTSHTTQTLAAVSCVSPTQCWAVGTGGVIVVTSTGGSTWTAQTSGTGNNLNGVSCVSSTQCWAVGNNGELLVTANGGSTWTAQTSGTGQTLDAVDMVSSSVGWAVGVGGTVLATVNGGSTWTSQGAGINQPVNAISASNPSDAMIGLTPGGDTPSILVTNNGGASWLQASVQYMQWTFTPTVAPGTPVNSAVVTLVDRASTSANSQTQTYLLVSSNSGSSWTSFPIANPTTTMTTQTVSVVSVLSGGAAVSGMELRYVVADANGFTSTFDLVHVDIN